MGEKWYYLPLVEETVELKIIVFQFEKFSMSTSVVELWDIFGFTSK